MGKKYGEDGVDIVAGDAFSSFCNGINKRTYRNSQYVEVFDLSNGNFRGPKGYLFRNLPEGCINTAAVDGEGTKVILDAAAHKEAASATNVIAMTGMDITRWGGLPLVFNNILEVYSLGKYNSDLYHRYEKLILGLEKLCHEHHLVSFTGETAETGPCIGSEITDTDFKFSWGGFMSGVYHPDKMILGDTLAPGQIIMALADCFRSNGISSVRKALAMGHGPEWWKNPEAMKDIAAAAKGSAQYDRFLNMLHGWFKPPYFKPLMKMHLIVHLSGGAFKSKLADDIMAKTGLSAEIDHLFAPHWIMSKCAKWRGMSSEECYETWNGGQGALVVIDPENEVDFIHNAGLRGIAAMKAGKIVEKKRYNVRIRSMFDNEEKYIEY